jgi:hypothetical protein
MKNRLSKLSKNEKYLIGVIIALIIIRCAILPFSPIGLAIDEAASGAHIASMVTAGTDAHGTSWPLFSESLGGGYTTPVYLYPAVVWAHIFGFGILSLRYFSEFMTLSGIALLALGTRFWVGRGAALITAATALALPWGWLQGSLIWDPAVIPFFVGLSFLSFSALLFSNSQKTKIAATIGLPISLVLLAYLYPPLRISAPLMYIGAYALLLTKKRIDWSQFSFTIIVSAIFSLPLLHFLTEPGSLGRSQNLLVYPHWPLFEAIGMFFVNILQLLSPWFFFINGDYNLRHSTGVQGMLGVAALPAIIACIVAVIQMHRRKKSKDMLLVYVALYGAFAAIIGSALTFEGQPHSLRASAAWPFLAILLAIGWRWLFEQNNKRYVLTAISIFAVATIAYSLDLAFFYPARSSGSFDYPTYQKAIHHQPTPGYPDIDLKYYRML